MIFFFENSVVLALSLPKYRHLDFCCSSCSSSISCVSWQDGIEYRKIFSLFSKCRLTGWYSVFTSLCWSLPFWRPLPTSLGSCFHVFLLNNTSSSSISSPKISLDRVLKCWNKCLRREHSMSPHPGLHVKLSLSADKLMFHLICCLFVVVRGTITVTPW